MRTFLRASLALAGLAVMSVPTLAQGPAFASPGQSPYTTMGQTTRFSRDFNPAIGFVLDLFAEGVDAEPRMSGVDGFDLQARLLELNASTFVDPDVWGYVALVAEDLETIEVEEAAAEYIGFEGNSTVKAGKFFVDFGKQMQQHNEELRTLERPLVLREFLGEELAGVGAQWDHWTPVGDMPVRFSVGVFGSLVGGHEHGEEEVEEDPTAEIPGRLDVDDFSFTARLTGMRDVGDNGILQLGTSARVVSEFSYHFDTLEADGLRNTVYGADVTYGWTNDGGDRSVTLGAEGLIFDGDISASVDDPMTPTLLTVISDDVKGFYAFADVGLNLWQNVGAQVSWIEDPANPLVQASEVDLYFTHHFTEVRRLRFGVTVGDDVEGVDDVVRAYVQFTTWFGTHAHGLNW